MNIDTPSNFPKFWNGFILCYGASVVSSVIVVFKWEHFNTTRWDHFYQLHAISSSSHGWLAASVAAAAKSC